MWSCRVMSTAILVWDEHCRGNSVQVRTNIRADCAEDLQRKAFVQPMFVRREKADPVNVCHTEQDRAGRGLRPCYVLCSPQKFAFGDNNGQRVLLGSQSVKVSSRHVFGETCPIEPWDERSQGPSVLNQARAVASLQNLISRAIGHPIRRTCC